MRKKIIAFVLSALMIVTLFATSAFAAASYLIDNNQVKWITTGSGWLFCDPNDPDNVYPSSQYVLLVGQSLPTTGTNGSTTYYYNALYGTWTTTSLSTGTGTGTSGSLLGGLLGSTDISGLLGLLGAIGGTDNSNLSGLLGILGGLGGLGGTTSGTTSNLYYMMQNATAYVYDSNGITWIQSGYGWYAIKDSAICTVSDYESVVGKPLPTYGVGYYTADQQNQLSFYMTSYGWVQYDSSLGGGIGGLTGSSYIIDTNGITWSYQSGAWVFLSSSLGSYLPANLYTQFTQLALPTMGYAYVNGTQSGTYYFDGTTWTLYSSGGLGDILGGILGGTTTTTTTNPNSLTSLVDTQGFTWVKYGSEWSSAYSDRYSRANPPRFIDSENRVWELYSNKWILNDYASGSTTGSGQTGTVTDPNSMSSVADSNGYIWTNTNGTWTSTNSWVYSLSGGIPTINGANGISWYLIDNEWYSRETSSTPGTSGGQTIAGYTQYVFNGKSYQIPTSTTILNPASLTNIPSGYSLMYINGGYSLVKMTATGYDTYPLPTMYALPSGYYYSPTGDIDNPWMISGYGAYELSEVTEIELDYGRNYKVEVGKSFQITVEKKIDTVDTGLNSIIIFSSSNPAIATVDQNGLVTVVGEGQFYITARAFLGMVETTIDFYGIPVPKPEEPDDPKPVDPTPVDPTPVDPTPVDPTPVEPATTPVYEQFTDISKDAWYVDDVQVVYDWLTKDGTHVMGGMTTTTFGPDQSLTTAQFVVMLSRMANADLSKYSNASTGFYDVDHQYDANGNPSNNKHWASAAIAWAFEKGLVSGVGEIQVKDLDGNMSWKNCFMPDAPLTKQLACQTLMVYAISHQGNNISLDYEELRFADKADVADWCKIWVLYCDQLGLIDERLLDNNKFYPTEAFTRAEIATVLARYVARFGK